MSGRSDVVLVVAHPDDEIFVSGTICLCVQRNLTVGLICVTDGEGAAGANTPPLSNERLAATRLQELSDSARALGIAEVVRIGLPDLADPGQGPRAWDELRLVELLRGKIEAMTPAIILTHGPRGGYGHPAHRLVYRCVMAATEQMGFGGSIFSFCAQVPGAFLSWHFDQPSDVRITVRDFEARRSESLACHRSQRDFFLQPYPPRTLRKHLSAVIGRLLSSTEFGRKRVPIGTPTRFFQLFPIEGLALQRVPESGREHFFSEYFHNDNRIHLDS